MTRTIALHPERRTRRRRLCYLFRLGLAAHSGRFATSIEQLVVGVAPVMGWGRVSREKAGRTRFVRAHRRSVQRWLDDLKAAGLVAREPERDNRGQWWRTQIVLLAAPAPTPEELRAAATRARGWRRRERARHRRGRMAPSLGGIRDRSAIVLPEPRRPSMTFSCFGDYRRVPELPDVEGFRRTFARHAEGKRVHGVRRVDGGMLRNSSPAGLGRALSGRRFASPRRHGKLLVCPTDGSSLLLHFGMTGALVWAGEDDRHDRLVLELDDGDLHYRNMRRLGGIWLAKSDGELARIEGRLGPDWLDVSRSDFEERLANRRASIKATLMDQSFAAGLGNLTSDESLWQARIDPRRPVASLDESERNLLYRKIQKVLRDSLPHGLVPAKRTWLTGARTRRNATCPRCGTPLRRVKVGGRTTVFCPEEQR